MKCPRHLFSEDEVGDRKTNELAPPALNGLPIVGLLFEAARNPLHLLERVARECGDIARFRVGARWFLLLNHPDWVSQVLVLQQNKFRNSDLSQRVLENVLGQGLLTTDGEPWRRQRCLAQPAFRRAAVREYAPTMIKTTQESICGWRSGDVRDVAEDMTALMLETVVQVLFSARLPGVADEISSATAYLMRYWHTRLISVLKIPKSWPTPANRRAQREHRLLDSIVYRIISERTAKENATQHRDFLALLMNATDEDGNRMTAKQLRDQTMTLFLAGHETTALTLAWVWFLLGLNPGSQARLQEELRLVLGGRVPEVADLADLPYLRATINETLRLYPASTINSRQSIVPFNIGGYQFPADTTVLMSSWLLHRDVRFFEAPLSFRPERWIDGSVNNLPRGAYFPFGDGPHRCIGQEFALLAVQLVVATIAQRFRFAVVPGHPVVPEQPNLRPRHGIRMTVHARDLAS
jgi:cytochrome P450